MCRTIATNVASSVLGSAGSAALMCATAHAQTAPVPGVEDTVYTRTAQTARAPEAADGIDAGDIIVTATKRDMRLQDVPVSLLVLSQTSLAQAGVVTTTELPSLTPGLTFTQSINARLTSFYIRGIGTYANTPALENSVGVAFDGVPLARMNGSIADLVDIDHVEVLKGPQGLLFGKNATGGLISIVSRKPEIGANSIIAHASYGSYDEANVDAAINYSPNDRSAFRLTAWRFGHDGIVRGSDGQRYQDKNSFGVRLGASVLPTEGLDVTVVGLYEGRDENGTAQTLRAYTPLSNPDVIAYNNGIGYVPSERQLNARVGFPYSTKINNYSLTALGNLDLGGGFTLSSITSYRDVNDDSSQDTFASDTPTFRTASALASVRYDQFTQELRISSPVTRSLSFVAGLFYYNFNILDLTSAELVGVPAGTRYGRLATMKNSLTDYAVFGEATFRISPSLRLIGGLRQSHDKTRGSVVKTVIGSDFPPPPAVIPGAFAALVNFQTAPVTYNYTSWRLGGQWDIAKDIMLYTTASSGFKAPGFNLSITSTPATYVTNGVPNNGLVRAETVKSYEAGVKSQFFDRRLTFNLTVFHSIFSNFQTTVAQATVPVSFTIQNANQLKSTGVEFEVSARPAAGLTIGVNGAYIRARYTDFLNAPCYFFQPAAPAGSPPTPGFCIGGNGTTNSAGTQSLNGVQLPSAPKWTINANARYETTLGDSWRGFLGGDFSYRSRQIFGGTNNPDNSQPGYGVLNATAGFGPEDERWTVSLYARNAFKQFFQALIRDSNGFYFNIPAYEAKRRIGAQLELRF